MSNNILSQKIHEAYITANQTELQRLWDEEVPNTLIKFFPAIYSPNGTNYFLEHLENRTIWLSSPVLFNDPFDCKYNYDYWDLAEKLKVNLSREFSDNKEFMDFLNSDFLNERFIDVVDNFKNRMTGTHEKNENSKFVSCFSEQDNLYSNRMWAHYANSHKGVCAEYDFKSVNSICGFGCIPVKYTNFYNRQIYTSNIRENVSEFLKLVYVKASEWDYEKEWRIVQESEDGGIGFNVKCSLPKKIFLGCKASNKLKEDVLTLSKDRKIEVFQMKLKPGSFDLQFEECK